MLLVPVPVISSPHAGFYIYTFRRSQAGRTDGRTSCPCLAAIWPAPALLWEVTGENGRVEWGGEICCHCNIYFSAFVHFCGWFVFKQVLIFGP